MSKLVAHWISIVRLIPPLKDWYKRRVAVQLFAHWQQQADVDAAWDHFCSLQEAMDAVENAEFERMEAEYMAVICQNCGHSRSEHMMFGRAGCLSCNCSMFSDNA